MFCNKCGKEIDNEAAMCIHCGVPTKNGSKDVGGKSRITYVLLAIFLGIWGIHNFYAGYKKRGFWELFIGFVAPFVLGFIVGFLNSFITHGIISNGGITTIILSILSGLSVLLGVGVKVVNIVEAVKIKTDAKGNLFR